MAARCLKQGGLMARERLMAKNTTDDWGAFRKDVIMLPYRTYVITRQQLHVCLPPRHVARAWKVIKNPGTFQCCMSNQHFLRLYYRIWPAKASKGFRFSLTYFKDYLHHHWASTVHRKRTTPKGWMYILVNPCNLPGRYHCAFGGFCMDENTKSCSCVCESGPECLSSIFSLI